MKTAVVPLPLLLAALPLGGQVVDAHDPGTLKEAYREHFRMGVALNRSHVTGGAGFGRSEELVASDEWAARINASYKEFQELSAPNQRISELAYMNAREL